jgi:membrane protease YdiL (CAAX protease family)
MMLNSPAWPNQWLGAIGTVCFLWLAFGSLGALRNGGMEYARWEPAPRRFWLCAVALGSLSAMAAMGTAHLAHQRIAEAGEWRMFLLQVALGPVLEEIIFRGYLIQLLLWAMAALRSGVVAPLSAVLLSAAIFAALHLARPGSSWKEFAMIASTGTLYGWVRIVSGSTGTASLAHAAFNATVHVGGLMPVVVH